ncbi:MAG: helix-turn-helix transcriptional regulator [Gemmatimonadota bacterium]
MTKRHAALGELETLVMLAILRLGSDAGVRRIREEISERAGRGISRGALYATLARMQRKGLVQVRDPVDAGESIQRFSLTEPGLRELREAQAKLDRMREGLGPLLRGETT